MTEPALSVDLSISLRYSHGLGDLSPYFAALTRGDALATRCEPCRRTWFAPRLVCACGSRDISWRPLAGSGVLQQVTSGRTLLPGTPIAGTFAFALIRMDGADNLCLGRIMVDDRELHAGQRVRLALAARSWVHPAQCCDFVLDAAPT